MPSSCPVINSGLTRDAAGDDARYEQEHADTEQVLREYSEYAANKNRSNIDELKRVNDDALADNRFREA